MTTSLIATALISFRALAVFASLGGFIAAFTGVCCLAARAAGPLSDEGNPAVVTIRKEQ